MTFLTNYNNPSFKAIPHDDFNNIYIMSLRGYIIFLVGSSNTGKSTQAYELFPNAMHIDSTSFVFDDCSIYNGGLVLHESHYYSASLLEGLCRAQRRCFPVLCFLFQHTSTAYKHLSSNYVSFTYFLD